MLKLTTLMLVAGLATAATTTMSSAAVWVAGQQNQQTKPVAPPNAGNCADEMGHMRRVKASDIEAIRGNDVWLIPICEELHLTGRGDYGALFVNGNVDRLRTPIARNATLMAALKAKGYDQNDVVSLRFGGNNGIVLYVYQRHMN